MQNMARPHSTESVFRALAHPARRAIVMQLAKRPCVVGELAQGLPLSLGTLSRHLHILNACGIIAFQKRGPRLMYEIVPGGLTAVSRWMGELSTLGKRAKAGSR
jgi:DNA-binding transcriptional ArsR family regulator